MTLDAELVKALQEDYRTAPISEQDQVMLDYVAQLTRMPRASLDKITNGCERSDSMIEPSYRSR